MLNLPIYVSHRSISTIQAELSRLLPDVSEPHCREAIAKGLGMRDSAALHEAIIGRAAGPVMADGHAFAACLARWDHQVPIATFYNASALSAMELVGHFLPQLGRSGHHRHLLPMRGEPEGFPVFDQAELLEPIAIPGFLQAVHFLQGVPRTSGKRPDATSYSLKHLAERHNAKWPDDSRIGTGYVTNGELIAAGIYLGFRWEVDDAPGSRDVLLDVDLRKMERAERTLARRQANNRAPRG